MLATVTIELGQHNTYRFGGRYKFDQFQVMLGYAQSKAAFRPEFLSPAIPDYQARTVSTGLLYKLHRWDFIFSYEYAKSYGEIKTVVQNGFNGTHSLKNHLVNFAVVYR
jgi:long-subunit fatty acid transport protein